MKDFYSILSPDTIISKKFLHSFLKYTQLNLSSPLCMRKNWQNHDRKTRIIRNHMLLKCFLHELQIFIISNHRLKKGICGYFFVVVVVVVCVCVCVCVCVFCRNKGHITRKRLLSSKFRHSEILRAFFPKWNTLYFI